MAAPATAPIRVLLADDQQLLRLGLKTLLESEPGIEYIGGVTEFSAVLAMAETSSPDVILLDFNLRDGDSTGRIAELLSVCPAAKVLILTACCDCAKHIQALRNGASGIFISNQPCALLIKAIRAVHAGELWVTHALSREVLRSLSAPAANGASPLVLTERETIVARLAVRGLAAKQIAVQLCISEKTVRNHLSAIYGKLCVHNYRELMLHAQHLDLQTENP